MFYLHSGHREHINFHVDIVQSSFHTGKLLQWNKAGWNFQAERKKRIEGTVADGIVRTLALS